MAKVPATVYIIRQPLPVRRHFKPCRLVIIADGFGRLKTAFLGLSAVLVSTVLGHSVPLQLRAYRKAFPTSRRGGAAASALTPPSAGSRARKRPATALESPPRA